MKALSRTTLDAIKGETELTIGGRIVDQAYACFKKMERGQDLEKRRMNIMSFNENAEEVAVKFMPHPSNVGTVLWVINRFYSIIKKWFPCKHCVDVDQGRSCMRITIATYGHGI